MSDSVRPHRWQPTRLPRPWDSPGKNIGVGCHFFLQCMKVKVRLLSHVRLFTTSWSAGHQTPPSMGFSRQEYWSGVPLPSSIYKIDKQGPTVQHRGLYSICCYNLHGKKIWKRICIHVKLNHFVTHLKLTQHCKSTILQ